MNKKLKKSKLLYKELDAQLSGKEQELLSTIMKNDPRIQIERDFIERLRASIKASAQETFGPFFADKVVNAAKKIREQDITRELFFEFAFRFFRKLALVGVVACLLLFSIHAIQNRNSTHIDRLANSNLTFEQMILPSFTASVEDLL
jgi:hypothetical protein